MPGLNKKIIKTQEGREMETTSMDENKVVYAESMYSQLS